MINPLVVRGKMRNLKSALNKKAQVKAHDPEEDPFYLFRMIIKFFGADCFKKLLKCGGFIDQTAEADTKPYGKGRCHIDGKGEYCGCAKSDPHVWPAQIDWDVGEKKCKKKEDSYPCYLDTDIPGHQSK